MEEAVGKDWFQLWVPIENRQRLRDRFFSIDHRDETRADTHHILTNKVLPQRSLVDIDVIG